MRFVKKDLEVGDIVTIKSKEWYLENYKNCSHCINKNPGFVDYMVVFCGKKFKISHIYKRPDGSLRYSLDGTRSTNWLKEYFE